MKNYGDRVSLARWNILRAIWDLREVRDRLKSAQCPNTLARVRAAIDSAEGALRNQAARDADPSRKRIKTAKARNRGARQWAIRNASEQRTDPHALPTLPPGYIAQAHSAHGFE
jgi:hypothetical protein